MTNDVRPLVFFHGWGFGSGIWSEFIRQHFQNADVTALDLPIYAGSSSTKNPCSLKEMADKIMNNIAADKIDLLGWSLGGQLAIECAHQFPDRVASLILIACNPCFVKKPDWPYGPDQSSIEKMQHALFSKPESVQSHFTGLLVKGLLNAEEKNQQLKALFENTSTEDLAAGLDLLILEDQRAALGDLDLPVNCLYGKKDRLISSGLASAIKGCNSAIDVTLFSESGHVPFLFESNKTAVWIKKRLGRA